MEKVNTIGMPSQRHKNIKILPGKLSLEAVQIWRENADIELLA